MILAEIHPILENLLASRFVWGLVLGLLVTFFVWKTGFSAKRNLKREIKRLHEEARDIQSHLNTQLKLNATGSEALQKQVEELKIQNENLRINSTTLQQKPGKPEARYLQIVETAVRALREQAPGFASAWEQAIRTAEDDYEASEKGLKRFVKRIMPSIGTTASSSGSKTKRSNNTAIEAKEVVSD